MALVWLWWPAWFPFGTVVAAAVCAAGVAFDDIDLHFLWQAWRLVTSTCALRQAWHLATSTFTLCGRRGAWRHRRAFCVAGVALMALVWLWWRIWFPFGTVVAAAVSVAGVTFGDIDLHFLWQAWRLVTSTCALRQAWHLATSTFTLCGRRGAWRHRRAFCVAGVALMALVWLWWRVWFPFGTVVAAAVSVAGVTFGDIDLHFVWPAWPLATSTFTLCGRHGAWQHRRAFCVEGKKLQL